MTHTTLSSTASVTLASLLEAKKKFDALPRPEFDCIVCLPAGWQWLRESLPEASTTIGSSPTGWYWLDGMPVYVAVTYEEAAKLMRHLERHGKHPRLFSATGEEE